MTVDSKNSGGDSSMIGLFKSEIESNATAIKDILLSLKTGVDSSEHIDDLSRAAHSIHGAARMMRFEKIAELAQSIDNYFSRIKDKNLIFAVAHTTVLMRGIDLLSGLIEETGQSVESRISEADTVIESILNDIAKIKNENDKAGETVKADTQKKESKEKKREIHTGTASVSFEPPQYDESMMGLFQVELDTHSTTLNDGLLQLEENPDDPENLEALMRAAHSIKGAARVVKLDPLVDLTQPDGGLFRGRAERQCQIFAEPGRCLPGMCRLSFGDVKGSCQSNGELDCRSCQQNRKTHRTG